MATVRVLTQGLVDLGFLSGDLDGLIGGEVTGPAYARDESLVGLDVHDVGAGVVKNGDEKLKAGPLAAGMAYTIEPGSTAPDDENAPDAYKGIGIRIEDNVVITDDGHINLTREIPKAADDIEAWVKRLNHTRIPFRHG